MMPHVATVAESAVPGFDVNFFFGIAAPAGVPPGRCRPVEGSRAGNQ